MVGFEPRFSPAWLRVSSVEISSARLMNKSTTNDKTDLLESLLDERILVLDGAMGTQIQALGLDERGVRGERFAGHHKDLKNFADILCLTHPDEVTDIHRRYLAAGADIVETNTFGASPIGMEEFELPRRAGARDQRGGRGLCPPRLRRVQRANARPAAVRRRLDRPDDQADGHQHEGRRRQLSRRDVRRDGRVVLRSRSRRWSRRASTSCCPKRSSTRST